jgi:phenylalanyl-tRNA synthetase beta chain
MKVTLSWLKEYVDLDLTAEQIAEIFDLSGTEVDSVTKIGGEIKGVVVGEVKSISPHPQADRLSYCRVDLGEETRDIVCGAKNISVGDKVPVALEGAVLPNGQRIKKSKIRGLLSEGMICSGEELKLEEKSDGVMILSKTAPLGCSLSKALELEDWLFDLEITPNRPDCLGVIGLARELAAITGQKLKLPKARLREGAGMTKDKVEVEVVDTNLCPRYVARVIEGVRIAPSPYWLSSRLRSVDIRPVNNVVDVTNYVMMVTGQPLHAFDLKLLKGRKIIVRRAKDSEAIITIDHQRRFLTPEMLVIADEEHPVALAGIMGGFDSEISEGTQTLLLESANFKPSNIMRTSRKLNLTSESSYRFEKGVDIGGTLFAANLAAQLIVQIAGGELLAQAIDLRSSLGSQRRIAFRVGRVNKILGTKLSASKVEKILNSLEIKTSKDSNKDKLMAKIPTFRVDLEREIDLIEEVARLHGLNNIASNLPQSTSKARGANETQLDKIRLVELVLASGFSQAINYSFISQTDLDKLQLPEDHPWRQVVSLSNPISEEQSIMRPTLLPSLLGNIAYNLNRGETDLGLFELGKIFIPSLEKAPKEVEILAIAATGRSNSWHWSGSDRLVDFFDLKGLMEFIAGQFNLEDLHFQVAQHPSFHPGITAEILAGNSVIGLVGQIHPAVQSAFQIKQAVVAMEILVDSFLAKKKPHRAIKEIPKFPFIDVDLAFVVSERVTQERLSNLISSVGGKLLESLNLFDVYRGPQVPSGTKSLAYRLRFRSSKRTLTESEVEKIKQRIIRKAEQEVGAHLRT